MFRRNFFGAGPWDGARGIPTVRLAGRPRARLGAGGNGCVVPGTQEHPVFQYNPTTKACSVFWIDPGGSYPDCVQAPPGYPGGSHNGWIPPSCLSEQAPTPSPTPTPKPPGLACPMGNGLFTLLNSETGAVIAENISRDQFNQYADNVTDLPPDADCSSDSRCAPVCNVSYYNNQNERPDVPTCCTPSWSPGQNKWLVHCNAVDERGINQGFSDALDKLDRAKWDALCAYVPPGGCRAGLAMIAGQCSSGAIACGDRLVEIDENSQPTGRILSEHWNTEHPTENLPLGVHMVNETDPRCQVQSSAPSPAPVPTSTPTPTSGQAPTPTVGPTPTAPSTTVTPGASVPIVPGPFPSAPQPPNLPIAPRSMPSSAPPPVPQKGFAPATISPSCKVTPYKTRLFPQTTVATRPDQFTEKQQWTT